MLVTKKIQEMVGIIQDLEDETMRWNPAPEEWSIIQIVSHITESIPYWVDLTKRIVKDPNTKMERTYFSESRLAVLTDEHIEKMAKSDAIEQLQGIPVLIKELLETLTTKEFEEEAVQFIVDVEVIKHIDGHIHQIKRNLSNEAKHKAQLKFDFLK